MHFSSEYMEKDKRRNIWHWKKKAHHLRIIYPGKLSSKIESKIHHQQICPALNIKRCCPKWYFRYTEKVLMYVKLANFYKIKHNSVLLTKEKHLLRNYSITATFSETIVTVCWQPEWKEMWQGVNTGMKCVNLVTLLSTLFHNTSLLHFLNCYIQSCGFQSS